MIEFKYRGVVKYKPKLDKNFRPIAIDNREYVRAVNEAQDIELVKFALIRNEDFIFTVNASVLSGKKENRSDNIIFTERKLKTLLWLKGGWKVIFAGPNYIGQYLIEHYATGGERQFDAEFMGRIYGEIFTVEITSYDQVPEPKEVAVPLGRNWDGCRIGFDAGGSDRKVSAVIDGKVVYSEEVVWNPKLMDKPSYHYEGIMDSMKKAASKMPRVDAIGVSAAGIYIDNQVKAASLFLKVTEEDFKREVKNIFLDIAKEFNVPIEVANDGDVTALAGAMSLNESCILGIAMGTSEATGYVDADGNITGWLNELAFVPVDYNPCAMVDEWSGDIGCGVKYFSQDAVIKLAMKANIDLEESLSPAEKLKVIQELMQRGDKRAKEIYDSIGSYLGYTIAHYDGFYNIKHVLLLGRVTLGKGGNIIRDKAERVLKEEFPELTIDLAIPDEKNRVLLQTF